MRGRAAEAVAVKQHHPEDEAAEEAVDAEAGEGGGEAAEAHRDHHREEAEHLAIVETLDCGKPLQEALGEQLGARMGTLEGHVNAPFGGISIDVMKMNRVNSYDKSRPGSELLGSSFLALMVTVKVIIQTLTMTAMASTMDQSWPPQMLAWRWGCRALTSRPTRPGLL